MSRKWIAMLTICCLLLTPMAAMGSLAVDEGDETHYSLPVDDSPGLPVDSRFFLSDTEYEDPTMRFTIETGRREECDYWIVDIEIKDPSQLRTASADGWDSSGVAPGTRMAQRMNAVLAINGDYFSYKGHDYVVRQGVTYLNHLRGNRDILVIDEDGDFHGYLAPDRGDIPEEINGKKIINAFSFGPLLVVDGKIRQGGYNMAMSADVGCQRMALCQIGKLKYRIICCASPHRGSKGMTLEKFRSFVAEMGDIQIAYNLDGGDSTVLIINGQKINDVENPNTRDLADIIYFATAYPGVGQ